MQHLIDDVDAVSAVLSWEGAVPPTIDGPGACLALRAAMARFSGPEDHAPRRADVEAAVAGVDVALLAELTSAATRTRLGAPALDAVRLAREVPVDALASALGIEARVVDVDRIAAVIGRGEPSTSAADEAAERLLAAAPVATVSLLYQCLDATAALLLTTLHTQMTGSARVAAVPRTRRTASIAGSPGGVDVEAGEDLVVEIGSVGLEFGAGPHACPGRQLAETIVEAIVGELDAAGYLAAEGSVALDPDGRPVAMTLEVHQV